MTCPGGMECVCTFQRNGGSEGDHAFRWALPVMDWWVRAVEREFEGAARADLRVRDIQFVTGYARIGDGWMALPTMAYANEPRVYGPYWRETFMRAMQA